MQHGPWVTTKLCSALGIDTSDYSFPYVASWASGKEMKELKDSMDTIRLTAADFLEKLEAAVAERSAERVTAMQYAEKLIANREQEITIFDDEQRNLIVNFAFKLDDRAATEELVNGLAAALAEDDKEEVNRLMYDTQEKIENLPDGMIGLSEMHDYGYRKDDVLPLTKEGAREWHRLGERIYPLFRDGTAGDYVSQEGIELHDGIFGIKADAWDAILLEQREDYAEVEYARPDFLLTVINREQALRLYDEGKQIYLVRISPWPVIVTDRTEIERGSDTFQIATADLEQERSMTEQENMLLYGSEKQLGIYQITARDPEHDYRFMGLDYVEKKGITVTRADYDLIYAAPLTEKDTLDGIYERFNIQRPADFTGHSLSVSDVVVLNDGSTVKAYYVDSIGFAELPEFFKERNKRSAGKFSKCYGGYYREYSVNAKVARAIKTVFYALDVVNHGMQEKQSITVRCVDIEDLEKQAEAIRVEQIKLYESYADGVLRRDVYIEKKKTLSEKLAALQDSIRTEKEEQECADELDEEIRALTKQASEKTYIGGLTKECVDAFVSMVYLYDDQTMKIEFNCEDVIRRALEKYGA